MTTGLCGEEGTIWEGEGHRWKGDRVHEVERWQGTRGGKVKGIGSKTWVAPESTRIGERVVEHKKAGEGGSSPSESYGDSRAAKGLGEAKRD